MTRAKLALYLFGSPRVELDGQPVEITRRKSLALLVYLALNPKPHSRDALAARFWPGYGSVHARGNLRRAFFILNQTLPGEWFGTDRHHITLRQDVDVWVDVVAFRAGAQQHLVGEELERVATLYTDDFLGDFTLPDAPDFDEWQINECESLRRTLVDVLEELVRFHTGRRNFAEAIVHARRRVKLEPLHEPAQRTLMSLYVESGQKAAALNQYQECVRVLREELAISPAKETIALYREITQENVVGRFSEPSTVVLPADVPIEFHADPKHDQSSSYRISHANHSDQKSRNNLPHQLTPFVGRQKELAALAGILASGHVRLVTIVGSGGMGKTRLGLAAAAFGLNMKHFCHGVCFVPLAPLSSPEHIVPALAEALDFQLENSAGQTRTPQQQILDYLHQKAMLLILDNFEHLMGGVALITEILTTAPDVKILVTSRERLRLPGEFAYPIQGLDTGAQNAQTDNSKPDAVTLFIESAQRVLPKFTLSRENLDSVSSICQLVEGMPLGIELAAAWVQLLPPAEIVDELRHSLDFLAINLKGVPERHHSIRAVFDATWQRLADSERILFAQLSIFRGGFTREAVREITGATLFQLRTLADKSLIEHQQAHNRYSVHELLRQYGADQLMLLPDVEEAVRDHYASFYCALVEERVINLKGSEQQQALTILESERENLRAAWQWVCAYKDAARLDRAADGIGMFCELQGRYHEGASLFRQAREALSGQSHAQAQLTMAKVLAWQCAFARVTGDVEQADQLLQRSLDTLGKAKLASEDVRPTRAFVLLQMGHLALHSDTESARNSFTQSLTLYDLLADPWGIASAQEGLVRIAMLLGDYAEARQRSENILAVRRVTGDTRGVATTLKHLSHAVRREGRLLESLRLGEESEALYRQIGNRAGVAAALSDLGDTFNWLGRISEACEVLQESIAIYQDLGDRQALGYAYGRLASSHSRLGEYDQARREGELCLEIARELGDTSETGFTLMVLGKVAMYSGDYERACRLLQESVATLQTTGTWVVQAWSHSVMGTAAWGVGNLAQAREHTLLALRTGLQVSDFNSIIQSLQSAALLLSEGENPVRALELYSLARLHPKINSPRWFDDVVVPHFVDVTASLPSAVADAALARGRQLDVWETATKVLKELAD